MIKRNIWSIFYILSIGGFLFLAFVSYMKLSEIHRDYDEQQHNMVRLVSNSTNSLFLTQEMMLDILGSQLVKDNTYKQKNKAKDMLDELLRLNSSIVGFGLASPEGNLSIVSSNIDISKTFNLKDQEPSGDSFVYTLKNTKMVLGRTYFMKALGEWVIPIRKTIRNSENVAVAVMTAGLRVDGGTKLFRDNIHMNQYNSILILRESDHFLQYHSSAKTIHDEMFSNPFPEKTWEAGVNSITEKSGLSIETIKESELTYSYDGVNVFGQQVHAVAKYDSRYEIWTISTLAKSMIISDFLQSFLTYILIYIGITATLFFLFRFIATAENRSRKELIHQATHDPLTGLPNRSYLQQHISDWIYEGAPPFCLLYIDMNHFKSINDSFGHQFGDNVLVELARRMKMSADGEATIIRQGGDEFLILTGMVGNQEIVAHANDIIASLSTPYRVEQFSVTVGGSVGIAKYPDHGQDLDMLLRAADIAMYESKKLHQSVHLFADTMQKGYLNRLVIEQHLRNAIKNDELFMVYQPQIDNQGTIFGVEALLRWKNKELGFVPPNRFIPIAESTGIMPKIGSFVLNRVLTEMGEMQKQLQQTWQVSINISVRQFVQTNFLSELKNSLDKCNISKTLITLEITESLFIEDIDYILDLLHTIHNLGIRISMDDFGTGYSSLSILRKLPVDELKIDKSFVDTILNDSAAQKMIKNIIAIGKNLEMVVLAEGVETKEQETLLKGFNCDCFQGYYYSKPLPPKELLDFINSWSSQREWK